MQLTGPAGIGMNDGRPAPEPVGVGPVNMPGGGTPLSSIL